MSNWNPFSWDFWTSSSSGAAAAQETHQQVISQGHSAESHAENAAGRPTCAFAQSHTVYTPVRVGGAVRE